MKNFFSNFMLSISSNFRKETREGLRASSAPFISGDTFREEADFIYDELSTSFSPQSVKPGDVVFVKTDMLEQFFCKRHPEIANPYVLITHNSDDVIPSPFEEYLEDPKIIAWLGQNVHRYSHEKLIPIPVGIANRYWPHGSIENISKCQKARENYGKEYLLYMNFVISTYPAERNHVFNLFNDVPYCKKSFNLPHIKYLLDMTKAKFILCPRGNGPDSHRTWEALYMGATPIVRTSALDPMYKELPVVIVNEWTDITESFLEEKWEELSSERASLANAFFPYWKSKIEACKQTVK